MPAKYALSDGEESVEDDFAGASTSTSAAPVAKRRKLDQDDAPPPLLADPPNEAINLAPPVGAENTEAHVRPHATLSNGMPAKPQPLKATQSGGGGIKGKGKAAANEGGFEAVLRKLEEQRESGAGGGTLRQLSSSQWEAEGFRPEAWQAGQTSSGDGCLEGRGYGQSSHPFHRSSTRPGSGLSALASVAQWQLLTLSCSSCAACRLSTSQSSPSRRQPGRDRLLRRSIRSATTSVRPLPHLLSVPAVSC